MARVWGVQDADEKLSGWTSEDETDVAPTDETAVLESAIRAFDPPGAEGRIQSGGHFNSTTGYTAPAGTEYFVPPANIVAVAAAAMLDTFEDAVEFILANRQVWTATHVQYAIDGIHWQAVNAARAALNTTRTALNRQPCKFCEESASWPTLVNGDVRQYVDAIAVQNKQPDIAFSWVTDESDPPARVDTENSYDGFETPVNAEDAPGSAKLIDRSWIDDITV